MVRGDRVFWSFALFDVFRFLQYLLFFSLLDFEMFLMNFEEFLVIERKVRKECRASEGALIQREEWRWTMRDASCDGSLVVILENLGFRERKYRF
jgi:hypothetical protein